MKIFLLLFFSLTALAAEVEPFSYAKLSQLIKDNDVKTIDALIPLLPVEYRGNYTFAYDSRSAQRPSTSPDFPRAILFGEDAKFVLTFTKNPKDGPRVNAADNLELMEWNEKKSSFEFRELTFDGQSDPLKSASEINPKSCLACHGSPNPRPIWNAYNMWPGVYGSLSRNTCDVIKLDSVEHGYYKSFMRTGRKASRYKDLLPEMKPELNCQLEESGLMNLTNATGMEPNARLGELLTVLNNKRLKNLVSASPQYENYKYLLVALANLCFSGGDEKFLNEVSSYLSPRAQGLGLGTAATHKEVRKRLREEFEANKKLFKKYNKGSSKNKDFSPQDSADFSGYQAAVKYLFERLGIPWQRIALGFSASSYDFNDGQPFRLLQDLVADKDRALIGESGKMCSDLKVQSLKATENAENCTPTTPSIIPTDTKELQVSAVTIAKILSLTPGPLQQLQVCLNCHDSGTEMAGLSLDLESEEAFKKQLKANPQLASLIRQRLKGKDEKGNELLQMPLESEPFSEDKQKLIDAYLRDLLSTP